MRLLYNVSQSVIRLESFLGGVIILFPFVRKNWYTHGKFDFISAQLVVEL